MRLWHIDLIPYLPKSQLLAQWRELNSIFKKQDKHILINYIYNYEKKYLYTYTDEVIKEMIKRGYQIHSFDNWLTYFDGGDAYDACWADFKFREHDHEYLTICYYNLKEKYLRGQKDFTYWVWDKLEKFYEKEVLKNAKINL